MKSFSERIRSAFNKSAGGYEKASSIQKKMGQRLIEHIPSIQFQNIIDLGCGTGYTTHQLSVHMGCGKLLAIDHAEEMISKAQDLFANPNIQFRVASFDEIELDEYELVFSNMALQWSVDLSKTLHRIYAALKIDGILAFSMPIKGTLRELGDYFRIGDFYTTAEIAEVLQQQSYRLLQAELYQDVVHCEDSLQLLRSFKKTGASACRAVSHSSYPKNIKAIKHHLIKQLTYVTACYIVKRIE